MNFSEEDIEILLDLESFQSKLDEEEKAQQHSDKNDDYADEKIFSDTKKENKKQTENDLKQSKSLAIKGKENALSWFSYENMLQIIEIDPFNILSIINADFYAIQELAYFDNNAFLQANGNANLDSNSNKKNNYFRGGFYYHNCIIKEYIFDKNNKLLLYLNSNNSAFTQQHKEKSKFAVATLQKEKAEPKIKDKVIILEKKQQQLSNKKEKEGKFITELKTINEKDELDRDELDTKLRIIKENLENMILQFTKIDKINANIDKKLIEKSFLFLGDDETIKIIQNFNKAHDLSHIKLCYDYRDLIQNLLQEINNKTKKGIKFKTRSLLHNINFLYRSLNLNNDKKDNFFRRLTLEFPYEKREVILEFNSLVDFLYVFRNRKKILLDNYNEEIHELKSAIEKIIQDSIESFKTSLFENIKNEKLVNNENTN